MTDEKHPADDPRLTQVRSLQAVQKVIAGVAHDLNNPLAAILGYAHLLGGELEPAKVRQYAAFINSQALAARDLIDDLQECATSPTLRCVRTSVSDLAQVALAFRAATIAEAGVSIHTEFGPTPLYVQGDTNQLRKAIGRLIDNACYWLQSVPGGAITVSTVREGDTIVLEVADNGPGFTAEARDRAFDPTFTARRSGSGVGLGLPTALAIMDRHGGTVRIPVGDGGRVQLVLPAAADEPAAAVAPEETPSEPAIAPEMRRVLCIDDQDYILEIFADVFEELGVEMLPALDTPEGAAQLRPDLELVVCDFNLPSGNAIDFYRVVEQRYPELTHRFVLCSGDYHHPDVEAFLRAHPHVRTLPKPFTVMTIRALLDPR